MNEFNSLRETVGMLQPGVGLLVYTELSELFIPTWMQGNLYPLLGNYPLLRCFPSDHRA